MTIKWIRKEKRVSRVVETKSVLYEPDFDVNVDNDQESLIAIFPTWCANLVLASSPTLSKVTEIAKCLFFKRSYRRPFSSYLQPPLKRNSFRFWELEKWNCYICQKKLCFFWFLKWCKSRFLNSGLWDKSSVKHLVDNIIKWCKNKVRFSFGNLWPKLRWDNLMLRFLFLLTLSLFEIWNDILAEKMRGATIRVFWGENAAFVLNRVSSLHGWGL